MTAARRVLVGATMCAPLAAGCSRPREVKPGDSGVGATTAAVAPKDSSPNAAVSSPAPAAAETSKAAAAPPASRADSSVPSQTPRVMPSETVLTGKLVAGGLAASPVTSLQIEGGKPTTLLGPLEPELRRLGGATVWVTGAPAPNTSFTVTRYEIVSIDGAKPLVGLLSTRNGGAWLVGDRDTVRLTTAPAELTAKTGAKVWIVGRRSGTDVAVQSFGIIKEP